MFSGVGRKVRYDKTGGALLVTMVLPRYSYHLYAVPIASQWLEYYADQQEFIEALPENIKSQITVRLSQQDFGWDHYTRWSDQSSKVKIDLGNVDINSLIRRSRIYISTYNATTYLESLKANIPTIIYWNPKHWELNSNTKKSINSLENVGIFHRTPESAAAQLTKIWDDIDSWWQTDELQSTRKAFCDIYAASTSSPVLSMRKVTDYKSFNQNG